MASPDDPILIGTRYGYAQSVAPLHFSVPDRRQHVRLIGAPGTGKTELMRSMIAQDIAAGRGFAVIDGNGRLARAVLDLVPSSLTPRTALFAPGDTAYPVGLNIFDRTDDGDAADQAQLTVSHTVGAFKRIWSDSFLARSEDILANTVQALCELPDATFLSIPKMLNDPAYRARVVRHMRDPVIRQFWEVEYEGRGDRFNTEADAPVLNKVRRFLAVPLIRNIVGQRRSTINFRFMLDDSRVFIADLGQANAGEGETTLLGTLILASFTRAAHRRLAAESGEPPDFTLYINDFQNFSSSELARMLAICSDARVSLVVAYPYTSQLPDTVQAALETVGTTIVFRPGATDAERLEALFDGDITPGMLASLDNGHFAARVLQYGRPSMPLKGYLPPLSYLSAGRGPAIIRNSRERFAFPRHKVEGWIEQFLASASPRNIVKEHKRELGRMKRENTDLKTANRRKDDVIGVLVQGLRKESNSPQAEPPRQMSEPDPSQTALRPLKRRCPECKGKGVVMARRLGRPEAFSLICPHDPERLKASLAAHGAERVDQ